MPAGLRDRIGVMGTRTDYKPRLERWLEDADPLLAKLHRAARRDRKLRMVHERRRAS